MKKNQPFDAEEAFEKESIDVSDLEDFSDRSRSRRGVFTLLAAILVLVALVYIVRAFFFQAPRLYFSTAPLEDNQTSSQTEFALNNHLFITFDNRGPIHLKQLQMSLYKTGDHETYITTYTKEIVAQQMSRSIFFYEKCIFASWGAGKYRVVIKTPDGEELVAEVFELNQKGADSCGASGAKP